VPDPAPPTSRFVVRYRGNGPVPAEALDRAAKTAGVRLVDRSARSLLVEGAAEAVRAAFDEAGGEWLVAPEVTYEVPDPRPKVKGQSKE
jgi:hypothetical protein